MPNDDAVFETALSMIRAEQGRWYKRIYEFLIQETGIDTLDGAACESCDPLDVTVEEIKQAIVAIKEQSPTWISTEALVPEHGVPVWCWHQEWVNPDFCPTGVTEGFWSDGDGWTVAMWNAEQDQWDDVVGEIVPQFWAYPKPPPMI